MNHIDNQELLQKFIQRSPAAIAMFDHEMRYLLCSDHWRTDFRLSGDISQRSLYETFREVPESWNDQLLTIEKGDEEFIRRLDGTGDWVKWEAQPWTTSAGEIGGIIIFTEILSSRKWAKSALRQREQNFQLLVEGVKDYAIIKLDTNGHVVSWNAGAERIKGYQLEEIVGQHFSYFYPPEDIELGKPEQNLELAAKLGRCEKEGWRVRKDGTRFWANVVITALHDREGNLRGFSKVTQDITERKQQEESLRLLERAIASSSNGIAITDTTQPDNPIIYVNPRFEQMTGYAAAEVIGSNCRFLQGTNTNQLAIAQLRMAIAEGRECSAVLRNYRKDGTLFWNELRISPVRNPQGKLTNFIGIQTDITYRVEAEAALRQLLQRELLLGAMQERIRQSLKLEDVLNTTVAEVRQALHADRAAIYRFEPDGSGTVVVESLGIGVSSTLGINIQENYQSCDRTSLSNFSDPLATPYLTGEIQAIEDIYIAGLEQAHVQLLERFQVRANLVVPIFQESVATLSRDSRWHQGRWENGSTSNLATVKPSNSKLWGLLIVHHCHGTRQWQNWEIQFLKQLSVQLAIAIQQANLFEQLQAELARTQSAETALRVSEERLQAILDNSTAMIYVKDREGRFILVNRLFQTLFHLDREQIVGKTNHEIFPKEVADAFHIADQQVIASGTPIELEEVAPVEGVLHSYLSVKFPLQDATGVPYAVCGISTDITERQQAQESLRRTNSLLKAQQEAALDGILVIDENRKVASYNRRFKELWQIPDEVMKSGDDRQLLGYVLSTLVQPQEFIAKVEYLYAHPTESSRDEISLNDERIFDRYSSAVLSPEGDNYGRIWYFRDITRRKQAEEDLHKSNQQINKILESINDAFLSLDREWRFTYINSRAEQLLLRTKDELIGKNIWDEFPDAVNSKFYSQYHKAATEQVTVEVEEFYSPLNTWYQVRTYPYADGLSVYFHDINERKQAETVQIQLNASIQEREERFRTLVANIPGAVYRCACDANWTMEFISDAIAGISDYPASDFINNQVRTFASIIYPEDVAMVEKTILEGVSAKQPYIIEYRVIRADETVRWVYEKGQGILNKEGELIRLDGAIFDITERKAAEAELRDLGSALENAVEGISRLDTQGRYLAVNRAYASAAGYQPEEMIGMEWPLTVHPEDVEKMIAAYEQMLKDGKVEAEARGVRKDGSIFYKQLVMICAYDSQRRFIGHHCFMKDITERKAAEEALRQSEVLRESEAKTRALLDAIPDAMYRMNKQGIFLDFKAAKNDPMEMSADAVVGKNIYDVLPMSVAQAALHYSAIALSTNKAQVFEYQMPKGKKIETYEARVVVNGPDEVLAIVRDITERKEVERLKNEFVSIVSHELRTPLTSVRGSLSLISGGVAGEIPPQAKALVDIAYKNSERLILLINDILDIEKIESGKMDFHLTPLELMPLVQQAIDVNRGYSEQFGVQLVLEPQLTDAMVNVDRDRLMQVITNLLSNAAKFSPPNGQVKVCVSRLNPEDRSPDLLATDNIYPTYCLLPSSSFIRVAITDQGTGIPEEFRSRIFKKFAQADSSDTRQKGGTGLGLSICKAIVEKLGGQIGFTTTTNVGSTFYFDLPEWQDALVPIVSSSNSSDSLRILVCEDDPDIAQLLWLMLKQEGLSADIAYSAAQAKQLLGQNRYAAMTVDLALPGQDGISLIRELREAQNTHSLPIVVVSAKAQQGRQEFNGGGLAVIDWLDKPIDQQRLMAAVRQAVRQQTGTQLQILYVEDDPDLTQVVSKILQTLAEIDSAKNLQEAKHKLRTNTYDLVILDLSLPDGSGLELLPYLNNQARVPIPAVVFSANTVGIEAANHVAAALVKSRTSNQQLLDTIKSLIGRSDSINTLK